VGRPQDGESQFAGLRVQATPEDVDYRLPVASTAAYSRS
jgi:hypothetical protein